MRRALNWIVGLPIAIVIIGFAIANRQSVIVSLDPLSRQSPFASIELPLWALLFSGLFLGMLAGWVACWFAQAKWRKAAREARIEVQRAEADLHNLRRDIPRETLPTANPGPF